MTTATENYRRARDQLLSLRGDHARAIAEFRWPDVGDTFMTVIETCRANGANPFDYILAVVRNSDAVRATPGSWMPWNYDQTRPSEAPT